MTRQGIEIVPFTFARENDDRFAIWLGELKVNMQVGRYMVAIQAEVVPGWTHFNDQGSI